MLHRSQFAYRKKTSTEHAVLTMTEEWRKNLDKGFDVVALFIDLSKAFDTVDHNILLAKLEHYNFHPNFIRLIKNYLEDRSIKVKVNDSFSESCPIRVGVPQGVPLFWDLYFLLFISTILTIFKQNQRTFYMLMIRRCQALANSSILSLRIWRVI